MSDDKTNSPQQVKSNRLKNNLWFAYVVFLTLWAACAYFMLVGMIREHKFFALEIDQRPYISDFVNVYNSASLAAACLHQKIDIYSPTLQAEYANKLTAPVVAEQPFYLQYPPFLFTLVSPLAFFNMLGAWIVWCSGGIALLIASAIALTKNAAENQVNAGISKFTLTFIIIATLASFPAWFSVRLGQTSLLLVPGLVAFWILLHKRKNFLAGLAAGVVLVKLQYLPPVFIIGFLMGGWSFLQGFTLIGLILLAVSILILGPENVMNFPHALLQGESGHGVSGVSADEMQNLRGNLTLFLGDHNVLVPAISIGAFAIGLAILAFLWWRTSKVDLKTNTGSSLYKILASISTLLMLVLSPHCHTQDYLALVIPCIWLWFEIKNQEILGQKTKILKCLKGLILFFPLIGWPFFILRFIFQFLKIQPFFLWALIVICLALSLFNKAGKQNTEMV